MSRRAGRPSRRNVFAPHASDPLSLRRCPICQWAIEQDHAEALAMHNNQTLKLTLPTVGLAPERDGHDKLADADFVLV